jgi:hypothetical protein
MGKLSDDEMAEVYDQLAKVAGYSDGPGVKRPNLWGMLCLAVKAVVRRNPGKLTAPLITAKLNTNLVNVSNAKWALGKAVKAKEVEEVMSGDNNFTTYRPTWRMFRGIRH